MTKSGKSSGWYRERKDELHTFKDTTRITFYTNKLNMRKIFTFLVLLCCATTLAFSAPVGRQQARQAALAFIKSHASTNNSQVVTRVSQAAPSLNEVASTNAYYIFNVGK